MKNSEIADELTKKLAGWTQIKSKTVSIITCPSDVDSQKIRIRSNYSLKKFPFLPGQLVERRNDCCSTGCSAGKGIVVGVGKGCPKDPKSDELWFLWEGSNVISHYCGAKADILAKFIIVIKEEEE